MSTPSPKEKDFDVVVVQGTTRRVLPIRAPNADKAINQANRILKNQGVKPAKVLGVTERK